MCENGGGACECFKLFTQGVAKVVREPEVTKYRNCEFLAILVIDQLPVEKQCLTLTRMRSLEMDKSLYSRLQYIHHEYTHAVESVPSQFG